MTISLTSRLEKLVQKKIAGGEYEIDRGEYVEYDENTIRKLASDVHERGLKRLGAERKKTGANR